MSYTRSSINDYPEHLNPFYEGDQKSKFWKIGKVKRSSSFSEALRNTFLFKSFRGKKKKQVNVPSSPPELRRNEARVQVQQRQTLPTIVSPSPSPSRVSVPVLLPRSRFSERVAKTNVAPQETVSKANSVASLNPFEEDEALKDGSVRIRRRKRRAPLPPNSAAAHDMLGVSSAHNLSKWSLSSDATDFSTYSDNENLSTHVIDPSVSINISNIVKEIEKLAEEDDIKEKSNEPEVVDVPDVVSSSIEVTAPCKDCDKSTDENFNVVSEICDKDTAEDKCPDVLYNTSCHFDIIEETVCDVENDSLPKSNDSLTDLINSVELNNNDNHLEDKTDSLTNIINSIAMIDNECYEAPASVTEISKEDTIMNLNLNEALNLADKDDHCKESSTVEDIERTSKKESADNVTIT